MREAIADLWEYDADLRCITTNGFVKNNGEAVMGRGCAKEATERYPGLPEVLGDLITKYGNVVQELGWSEWSQEEDVRHFAWDLVSFPVKHHWREKADLELIERSTHQLVKLLDNEIYENSQVVIPRPGCGNGQRDWETEVRPILEPILDDRFVVVTK